MGTFYRPSPDALLNPCADPIFKSLFTQESNESKQALCFFLSAMLKKSVSDVVLQPNELAVESSFDRQTQFDLTCKANSEPINVEMQGVNLHSLFKSRAEYHVAHLLNHYMVKGTDERDIPKVYQISVVNFVINKDSKEAYSHFIMRNIYNNKETLNERMNVIFLELPKIFELEDDVKKLTEEEQWGKFFMYANNPEKREFLHKLVESNQGIKYAMEALDFLSKEELEWQRETSYWKYVMDVKTAKNEAQRIGYAEGMAKGVAEGKIEGKIEGKAEGKIEAVIETAKAMLAEGISVDVIARCTKLSVDEIKKIK